MPHEIDLTGLCARRGVERGGDCAILHDEDAGGEADHFFKRISHEQY